MTYPAVPLGDQWTHPELADTAKLTARIDARLNAAAAIMRMQPGDNALDVTLRNATPIANNGVVKWDGILRNVGGAYNATTGIWTAPATGLYVSSVRLTQSSTAASAVQFAVRLFGLDTGTYPGGNVDGNTGADQTWEASSISGFPIVATAGDQFYIAVATSPTTSPFVNDYTSATIDRAAWTVQYLGEFVGGVNPGTVAPAPLVGDQWLDGEPVNDLKLYRRFDQPMDVLQPFLTDYGAQRVAFLGSYIGKATPSDGSAIPWTVEYDTGAGWDANNSRWSSPVGGLFIVSGAVCANADVAIAALCSAGNNDPIYAGARIATGAGSKGVTWSTVRLLGPSESVSVTLPITDVTTHAGFRSWLAVTQIG